VNHKPIKRVKEQVAPRPKRPIESPKPKRTTVYIVGDWPIVAEYVELCSSHGFSVAFDCNSAPSELPQFDAELVRKAAQIPHDAALALEFTNVDLHQKRRNLELLDQALPPTTAIVSSSVTISATEQSSWIKHKSRLVGCGALPTLVDKPLIEIAPTVFSPTGTVEVVQRFFRSIGKEIELVQDRVGLVFPRIVCQIINEAAFALQDETTSPRDIDLAMKLGAHFPIGPIEWADRIGLQQVYAVLSALLGDLAEDRYRISPLLKQMAVGGTWWHRAQATIEER
jgi:3-hydroxybutyryl-CoA dehydrogenase